MVLDPDGAKRQVGRNSYWWWGIAGTWFWIDPANDVLFVGMIQRMPGGAAMPNIEDLSRALTMQALVEPTK